MTLNNPKINTKNNNLYVTMYNINVIKLEILYSYFNCEKYMYKY